MNTLEVIVVLCVFFIALGMFLQLEAANAKLLKPVTAEDTCAELVRVSGMGRHYDCNATENYSFKRWFK